MIKSDLYGALSRGYCSEKNKHKVVDPDLIEAMADEILLLYCQNQGSFGTGLKTPEKCQHQRPVGMCPYCAGVNVPPEIDGFKTPEHCEIEQMDIEKSQYDIHQGTELMTARIMKKINEVIDAVNKLSGKG
jgi:hypothetical protein